MMEKPPTLGALVLFYVCAIGTLAIYVPPMAFEYDTREVMGVAMRVMADSVGVTYAVEGQGDFHVASRIRYDNGPLRVGDSLEVWYSGLDPEYARIPLIEGGGGATFPVGILNISMAIIAIVIVQRSYWAARRSDERAAKKEKAKREAEERRRASWRRKQTEP